MCSADVRDSKYNKETNAFNTYKKGKSVPLHPEVLREFQEVKVPRLRDNGAGWW